MTSTHSDTFHYSIDNDTSGMISNDVFKYDLIKIDFKKDIQFGNEYTRNKYHKQLNQFLDRYRHCDTHFNHTESEEIPGFQKKMLSLNGSEHSVFFSSCLYIVFSLLLFMTWPYRIWIESKCLRGEFVFKKQVYC